MLTNISFLFNFILYFKLLTYKTSVMQNFADKYEFKDHIAKMLLELDINKVTFEKMFAEVFLEIYDKEKHFPYVWDLLKISVVDHIIEEIGKIKKADKPMFLPLFEDYQKLNGELSDLIAHLIKESEENPLNIQKRSIVDLTKYPVLYRIVEHNDLATFKPDYVTSAKFIEFFESNIGKCGLYFLYDINKELLFVGKSISLGETILK